MDNNFERLKNIGFSHAGEWQLVDGSLRLQLDRYANARNILYAFVIADQIMYIGKTVQNLSARMAGYRSPGPTQSTNIKNNNYISTALGKGNSVLIYVLPDNGLLHYGGFHINLAAGLEDSLIRELLPPWNGGKKENRDGLPEPVETE